MPHPIPETFQDLFHKKALAHLATLMPDGSPQVTPVWVDFDGTYVFVNSVKGRVKDRNIRRDPRVSLSISDPENPSRYVQVRGRVVELIEEGADEHMDRLAQRYLGVERFPGRRPGEVRIIYKIVPERVSTSG